MMSILEKRKTHKPLDYDWAVEAAEASERIHWIHDETDFSPDVLDWKQNLTKEEKNLLHQILKLFTQSDVQVASMYVDNLLPVYKNQDIQQMLLSFAGREGIHVRAYSALLETLNLPDSDFEAFLEYKQMADKIEFMDENDIHSHKGKAMALVKNIFSEGVSLFGSFIMILNFQRFGKMRGMNEINRWSILDEQCLIGDTEVQTRNGWKNIKNVTLDDEVLQYNQDTKKSEYVKPTKLIQNTTTELHYFESDNFSQVVTPEHRMVTKNGEVLAKNVIGDEEFIIS